MRTAILMGFLAIGLGASLLTAQTASASLEAATISTAKSMPIPRYLVYRHFLAWVNDLDKKNAGASDAYQFAKPFADAHLANSDLDALRTEARTLDSALAENDGKAKAVIAEYRSKAQNALRKGPRSSASAGGTSATASDAHCAFGTAHDQGAVGTRSGEER